MLDFPPVNILIGFGNPELYNFANNAIVLTWVAGTSLQRERK